MADYFETPPFLVWSIRQSCQLRQRIVDDLPMSCERYLRPIREWGNATVEGRIKQDVCLSKALVDETTMGFPVKETLATYGGAVRIEQSCSNCQCNIPLRGTASIAGCYGEVPLPSRSDLLWDQFEQASERLEASTLFDEIPKTSPRWYGLWLFEHYKSGQLELLRRFLTEWASAHTAIEKNVARETSGLPFSCEASWLRFSKAIDLCDRERLTLDLQLIPAGIQEGRRWRILPYCANCRSTMNPNETRCVVCGKQGKPQQGANRCARGSRPFMPLNVFLTEEEIKSLANAGPYRSDHER